MSKSCEIETDWKKRIKKDTEYVNIGIKKSAFEKIAESYGDFDAFLEDHLLSECYTLEGAQALQKYHPEGKIRKKE